MVVIINNKKITVVTFTQRLLINAFCLDDGLVFYGPERRVRIYSRGDFPTSPLLAPSLITTVVIVHQSLHLRVVLIRMQVRRTMFRVLAPVSKVAVPRI